MNWKILQTDNKDNLDNANCVNKTTVINEKQCNVPAEQSENEYSNDPHLKNTRNKMLAQRVVSLMLDGVTKDDSNVESKFIFPQHFMIKDQYHYVFFL